MCNSFRLHDPTTPFVVNFQKILHFILLDSFYFSPFLKTYSMNNRKILFA
uniref:Uncharacterized protein n=1 Tax=Lepeophtheirus salmonis TaxID=72036 RepID=A0A0K2UD18_LEPSM